MSVLGRDFELGATVDSIRVEKQRLAGNPGEPRASFGGPALEGGR